MNGFLGFGLALLGVLIVSSLVVAIVFHVAAYVERWGNATTRRRD